VFVVRSLPMMRNKKAFLFRKALVISRADKTQPFLMEKLLRVFYLFDHHCGHKYPKNSLPSYTHGMFISDFLNRCHFRTLSEHQHHVKNKKFYCPD
jgi:hypothetical protein